MSLFVVGTVYCIPLQEDEWVVCQVSADASSIGMFDLTIDSAGLKKLRQNKYEPPDFGDIRQRLMYIKQAPSRGKWLRIGVRPLHPKLTEFLNPAGHVNPVYDPPEFHLWSEDWQVATQVTEEDFVGVHYACYGHDDGLWRWITGEPQFIRAEDAEEWRRAKRSEIWRDPDLLKRVQYAIPLMLLDANDWEVSLKDPRFLVPKHKLS